MINKNIDDISYEDIKSLLDNKIDESDTLDYKSDITPKNKDLMKHVCAFANTRGGDIIFGINESGNGGHPTSIKGLDTSDLNKEKIEQIILSNIVPRLEIKIKILEIPKSTKSILLLRIPDSYLKPHQNNINKKFYKRFQLESADMTEQEICDCYRRRFSNNTQVKQYVEEILSKKTGLTSTDTIKVNAIIIPSNIEHRLIETSDYKKIKWINSISLYNSGVFTAPSECFLPSELKPFSHGLISKNNLNRFRQISIHRNGCIHYIEHHIGKELKKTFLPQKHVAVRLMHLLQFTSKILQHYNYFGDVRIMVMITCPCKHTLNLGYYDSPSENVINEINCKIEREYSLQYVETNYQKITSSIMNEVFNYYGVYSHELFDEDGNLISENLRSTRN